MPLMGAPPYATIEMPQMMPLNGGGCGGISLNFVGQILNKKPLFYKGF